MTKEAGILKNHVSIYLNQCGMAITSISSVPVDEALKNAMSEYAKQEAIAFAIWIRGNINPLYMYTGLNVWEVITPTKQQPAEREYITNDQLYELYLQSKTNNTTTTL